VDVESQGLWNEVIVDFGLGILDRLPCLPNGMYFQFYSIGVECIAYFTGADFARPLWLKPRDAGRARNGGQGFVLRIVAM